MTVTEIQKMKTEGQKITMLTCYDYWSARILNSSKVHTLLVGDSGAMVMHGAEDTIEADVEMMALHAKAVRRGAPDKFIVCDLPFLSYRRSLDQSMDAVMQVMKAGAHAIKLEGAEGNVELIRHLVHSGVPVMGHLGLTPQFVHQLGGFKVQGRGDQAAKRILEQAKALEDAGCFSLVLEAIPTPLAETITSSLQIPTIGIGAGSVTDGQVLVLHDMLGLNTDFKPKFVRTYLNGAELISTAINSFCDDVEAGTFPGKKESYSS